jgi:methylated-DNA-[protein]-cysteine S-methyltransferase
MYYSYCESPLGDILISCNENSITGLWIRRPDNGLDSLHEKMVRMDSHPVLLKAARWVDDYFAGKKPDVSGLSLAPEGSGFRQLVWKLLLNIPYGEVVTYGSLAKEAARLMGKEKMSAQAIGGAVGNNPISIIIPCHRVVGANKKLTGYGGGIHLKVMLLEHEGVDLTGYTE